MFVLIDFDNVHVLERKRGLLSLVNRILLQVGESDLAGASRVTCRLYGGWFEETRLSRAAQQLVPQLQSDFPAAIPVGKLTGASCVKVNVEMAYGLTGDSGQMTHTFRTKNRASNLRCDNFPFSGCSARASCPLSHLETFINSGNCPEPGCTVVPSGTISRAEQKLVDTMITADLVALAISRSPGPIVLVSNDDDLIPGIRMALINGASVIHVHPIPGRSTPKHYQSLTAGQYRQVCF